MTQHFSENPFLWTSVTEVENKRRSIMYLLTSVKRLLVNSVVLFFSSIVLFGHRILGKVLTTFIFEEKKDEWNFKVDWIAIRIGFDCNELVAANVVWLNPRGSFNSPYFARASRISVRLDIWSVIHSIWRVDIKPLLMLIAFEDLEINIETLENEKMNSIYALGQSSVARKEPSNVWKGKIVQNTADYFATREFVVNRILIDNAKVNFIYSARNKECSKDELKIAHLHLTNEDIFEGYLAFPVARPIVKTLILAYEKAKKIVIEKNKGKVFLLAFNSSLNNTKSKFQKFAQETAQVFHSGGKSNSMAKSISLRSIPHAKFSNQMKSDRVDTNSSTNASVCCPKLNFISTKLTSDLTGPYIIFKVFVGRNVLSIGSRRGRFLASVKVCVYSQSEVEDVDKTSVVDLYNTGYQLVSSKDTVEWNCAWHIPLRDLQDDTIFMQVFEKLIDKTTVNAPDLPVGSLTIPLPALPNNEDVTTWLRMKPPSVDVLISENDITTSIMNNLEVSVSMKLEK